MAVASLVALIALYAYRDAFAFIFELGVYSKVQRGSTKSDVPSDAVPLIAQHPPPVEDGDVLPEIDTGVNRIFGHTETAL